jgi:hypothetical protein
MSLRATAAAAVERHAAPAASSPLRETPGANRERTSTSGDVVAQLVRYLPAELVAAYTTVVGVLPLPGGDPVCTGEFTARWIALAGFAVLTPVTLQTLYIVKRRAAGNAGPTVSWFEHVAAIVAFGAWSLALPLTPLSTWCDWQPQYGAAIAAAAFLVLGLAAQLYRPLR